MKIVGGGQGEVTATTFNSGGGVGHNCVCEMVKGHYACKYNTMPQSRLEQWQT